MLFDIDLAPELGHTLVPLIWYFGLTALFQQGESGEQSFHLAQWSQ
jgi:hypothetical protein